jgi:hypothetical protein
MRRFLFAPFSGDAIDWEMVAIVHDIERTFQGCAAVDVWSIMKLMPEAVRCRFNFVATDIIDYQRRVVIHDVAEEMSPLSEMREPVLGYSNDGRTYSAHYRSIHKRIPYTKQRLPSIYDDQPMMKVTRAPLLQNYLCPNVTAEHRSNIAAKDRSKLPSYRIPQFLIFNPIPAAVFRTATIIPSFLARIESIFLARSFQSEHQFSHFPVRPIFWRGLTLDIRSN